MDARQCRRDHEKDEQSCSGQPVLQAEPIPEPSVTITDIINLVQKTKGNDQTFSQLADSAPTPSYMKESGVAETMWSSIRIEKTRSITQIDQTGGTLHEYSSETWRQVTGSSNGEGFSAARPIRPTSMFLVAKWKTSKLREKLNDKQLYVASKDTWLHITKDQWAEIAGLQSNQEEADTRIILHAAHAAAQGYRAVVVTADDTGVVVICLAFFAGISCPLFQKCGTKNRVRYIDIN